MERKENRAKRSRGATQPTTWERILEPLNWRVAFDLWVNEKQKGVQKYFDELTKVHNTGLRESLMRAKTPRQKQILYENYRKQLSQIQERRKDYDEQELMNALELETDQRFNRKPNYKPVPERTKELHEEFHEYIKRKAEFEKPKQDERLKKLIKEKPSRFQELIWSIKHKIEDAIKQLRWNLP